MEVIQELFTSLESNNPQAAEDAKNKFHELFTSTKESWLLNGMFDYYLNSGSVRAIDVLICVREPHDRYLFDRLSETLRGGNKFSGLTLLGHVVRRHPSWIYKIASHTVFKDLMKVLKSEKDVAVLLSALLIVVMLLPIIASLISPHLQELFEIFSHLATWNTNNPHKVPESYLLHLELGMYALFNRLYGMFPCNFLSYLRQQYSSKESLPVFSRTIKPMLDTVKMHPLLVTATKELEISPNRWKKIEANDVIIECAKFSIESNYDRIREDCSFSRRLSSIQSKSRFDGSHPVLEAKHSDGFVELGNRGVPVVGSYSSNLPIASEVWTPVVSSGAATPAGATSIPHTPIIQGGVVSTYSPNSGNSPPEAAIEATPESTPVKVETITNRSKVSYPPGSPLRVIPHLEKQRPHTPGDRSDEDREVETTMTISPPVTTSQQVTREDSVLGESTESSDGDEWREWREGGGLRMPESKPLNHVKKLRCFSQCQPDTIQLHRIGVGTAGSSPKDTEKSKPDKLRKTISCPNLSIQLNVDNKALKKEKTSLQRSTSAKSYISSGMQTDPLVYELLLCSVLPPVEQIQQHSAPPDVTSPPTFREEQIIISSPRAALDSYIESTVKSLNERQKQGVDNGEMRQLKEQLILLSLQLQFERHRREVHAERNRRLLGRYRENRVLEEHNSALRDQVQLLQSEIEVLHNELSRFKREAKTNEEKQQESLNFWKEQNATVQHKLKDSIESIKMLNEDLKEEKRKKETIAKGYRELESEAFGLRNIMDDAFHAVQRAEELKAEVASLQLHLTSSTELEERLRSCINDLRLTSTKGPQAVLAIRSYENMLAGMQKKIDAGDSFTEAANEKLKRAEILFAKKEALAIKQNELIQSIKEEYQNQLKENEEECMKLRELNIKQENELLRLKAQVDCLEHQVVRQSTVKLSGPSPMLLNSPHLSSGSISIAEEMTQLQNLQQLIEGAGTSRDSPFPP